LLRTTSETVGPRRIIIRWNWRGWVYWVDLFCVGGDWTRVVDLFCVRNTFYSTKRKKSI